MIFTNHSKVGFLSFNTRIGLYNWKPINFAQFFRVRAPARVRSQQVKGRGEGVKFFN